MTKLQRARRVVAAAYARSHADGTTLELLEKLEGENAQLRASIDAKKRNGYTRSGRYVFGLTISASVLSLGLAALVYWYHYTAEGSCFRQGLDEGFHGRLATRAVSDVCKSHGGSILSDPRGFPSTDGARSGKAKIAEVRR